MKSQLVIIVLFVFASCYAQSKKDTLIFNGRDSLSTRKVFQEKKDTSELKLKQFLQANHIIFLSSDIPFFLDLSKPSLKEQLAKSQKTPKEQAEENLKNIMKEVKTETADKRSWLQKFFEEILDIAQKVAVIALAIKVLLK